MKPLLTLIAFLLSIQLAAADTGCSDLARSELEELFCTLKNTRAGTTLPSLADFRRNDPGVQALLLKRPARKMGLALPAVSTKTRRDDTRNASAKTQAPPPPEKTASESANPLHGCRLLRAGISCADHDYALADNQPNRALPPGVLSPANTLGFEPFAGDPNDQSAVDSYLAKHYRRYIEKMLGIGLAGVTMSYSKFYYTFRELSGKNEDFAERFETMFRYLKKDKSTMAVGPRHHGELPDSIDQCFDLSEHLVICDNGQRNWVFVEPAGEVAPQ